MTFLELEDAMERAELTAFQHGDTLLQYKLEMDVTDNQGSEFA